MATPIEQENIVVIQTAPGGLPPRLQLQLGPIIFVRWWFRISIIYILNFSTYLYNNNFILLLSSTSIFSYYTTTIFSNYTTTGIILDVSNRLSGVRDVNSVRIKRVFG